MGLDDFKSPTAKVSANSETRGIIELCPFSLLKGIRIRTAAVNIMNSRGHPIRGEPVPAFCNANKEHATKWAGIA